MLTSSKVNGYKAYKRCHPQQHKMKYGKRQNSAVCIL